MISDQRRPTEPSFQRLLERNVALALGVALIVVSLFGGRAIPDLGVSQADAFRVPLDGGGISLVAIVGLVLLNALFSAAETALELLKPVHVRMARDADGDRGRRLQNLLDGRPRYAAASQLGTQVSRIAMVLLGIVLAQPLALWLEKRLGWSFDFVTLLGSALLLAIPIALLNLVFGELVPRSYAALHPAEVCLRLYRLVRTSALVFSIPASLLVAIANLIARRFGGRASFTNAPNAEDEIKSLVETAQESGEIEVDEKELLHSVFEFTDTVAREVMTPRVDLDAMPVSSSADDVLRVIRETGHTRIPLYEETDDQIVGIIHAKDLLLAMVEQGPRVPVRALMRPALFVPENKNLHELLTELRLNRTHMAIVQDEFGGTSGVVTVEDIVEELVGDIVDEYDVEEPEVVEDERGFLVEGKTHLDDVNAEVGSAFESEDFDTVGGFVFGHFGRQPDAGEAIEIDGFRFTVAETDGRRILRLRVERMSEAMNRVAVGE